MEIKFTYIISFLFLFIFPVENIKAQNRINDNSDTKVDNPIQIGSEEQYFIDDYLIKSYSNILRQIQPAQKYSGNPVLWPNAIVYGSVIYDRDKYRIWYHSVEGVRYAESKDGIDWVEPLMDNVIVDGQKTNILIQLHDKDKTNPIAPTFYEIFGVHKDTLDTNPSHRYKMGFLSLVQNYKGSRPSPWHPNSRRGLGVLGSPDGIQWSLVDTFATEAIIDGASHWMFDSVRKKYILYGRTIYNSPEIEKAWGHYEWYPSFKSRAVGRLESDDFIHWNLKDPGPVPIVMTSDTIDIPQTDIYSMMVFPYESVYIGLVQVYNRARSLLEIQLAVSHDTYNFTRVGDRKPFIPVGPVGSWDRFNNSIANSPPIVVDDELRFYYGGRTYRHPGYKGDDTGNGGAGVGFATIKKGRFVSLEASFNGGIINTRTFIFSGCKMFINANCRFGTIKVSLIDEQGNDVPNWSTTLSGKDDISIPVSFEQGDLKKIASQKISFRFTLSNAQLFGFRITP